jgi:hypothetical protein
MKDPETMDRVADATVKDRLKTAIERDLLRAPSVQDLQAEPGPAKFSQVSHVQDGLRLSEAGFAPADDATIDEEITEFARRLVALRD